MEGGRPSVDPPPDGQRGPIRSDQGGSVRRLRSYGGHLRSEKRNTGVRDLLGSIYRPGRVRRFLCESAAAKRHHVVLRIRFILFISSRL